MAFEPGPGTGGSCLAVDPFHLIASAGERDVASELVEVAGRANRRAPYTCVERVEWGASGESAVPVRDARVAIVGVATRLTSAARRTRRR